MNVLIACNKDSYKNPFVATLADGISNNGVNVTCSLYEFWKNWNSYDIIHLQWPDLLMKDCLDVEKLENHLCLIKEAKKPIVITVHNLKPHYTNDIKKIKAYEIVYSSVDYFVHMGKYSKEILMKEYPFAKHILIAHHIYDTIYNCFPSREESIKKLKLNPNYRYILCFGSFRSDEERELVKLIAMKFKDRGYRILAPGFSRCQIRKNLFKTIADYIIFFYRKLAFPYIYFTTKFVKDVNLPFYYSSSDIALIHRKRILNSGNLPMAMMMGKVIVGPNIGNVGKILIDSHNPVFQINNMSTVYDAIELAIRLEHQGKGFENRNLALNNYSLNKIAIKYIKLFNNILNI